MPGLRKFPRSRHRHPRGARRFQADPAPSAVGSSRRIHASDPAPARPDAAITIRRPRRPPQQPSTGPAPSVRLGRSEAAKRRPAKQPSMMSTAPVRSEATLPPRIRQNQSGRRVAEGGGPRDAVGCRVGRPRRASTAQHRRQLLPISAGSSLAAAPASVPVGAAAVQTAEFGGRRACRGNGRRAGFSTARQLFRHAVSRSSVGAGVPGGVLSMSISIRSNCCGAAGDGAFVDPPAVEGRAASVAPQPGH